MASKTKILIGILALVIVVIGGWWVWNSLTTEKIEKPAKKGEIVDGLQLTINSNKKLCKLGEPIKINIKLKNVGKEIVVVNTGALDYLTLFLKFKIVDNNNNIEVEQIPRRYKPPQFDKSKDFLELRPGHFVESTIDILDIWYSSKEGNYNITAIYDIPAWCNDIIYEQEPEFKKIEMSTWTGSSTSNTITIEVVEKENVAITTDKREYKQGETIRITLKNNLEESIFSHIGSGTPVFCIEYIERKTPSGDWERLFAQCQPPHCIYDIDAPAEIKPSQSETLKWKPLIFVNGTSETVSAGPGQYRLLISYGDKTEWKSIYTNEFIIK